MTTQNKGRITNAWLQDVAYQHFEQSDSKPFHLTPPKKKKISKSLMISTNDEAIGWTTSSVKLLYKLTDTRLGPTYVQLLGHFDTW